jgi:hypothetical protein
VAAGSTDDCWSDERMLACAPASPEEKLDTPRRGFLDC